MSEAPDLTQLNSTQMAELSRVGCCDHVLKLFNAICNAVSIQYSHHYNSGVSWDEKLSEKHFEICSTLNLCQHNKQQWPESQFAWRTAATYEALWSKTNLQ